VGGGAILRGTTDIAKLTYDYAASVNYSEHVMPNLNVDLKWNDKRYICNSFQGKTAVSLAKSTAVPLAIGATAVVATPVVISAVGFGSGGVVAGSTAAAIHSSIGNVVAGSWFASMQSAGVLGVAASTKAAVGASITSVVYAGKCK